MHILIVGAGGRLGRVLAADLAAHGHRVTAPERAALDVTNDSRVRAVLGTHRPDVVVNCSAYNAVDAAERDPAAAFALNAEAPERLAEAADAIGARLVHFSTDFVFDGHATQPYAEDAPASPLSVYGASKLAGEEAVRRLPSHYILRVESLFGGTGVRGHRATVDAITDTILAGGPVRAILDRTVSPSYADDVAQATRMLVESGALYGTYHCVASGHTNWYELAREIARQLDVDARIEPILAADLQTPARRPQFCALSNDKLRRLGLDLPSWQSALARHLACRAGLVQKAAD